VHGRDAHPVLLVFVGDLQRLCGADHGLHGGEDVLVDQADEASLVLVRVARAVDDPHLLDEGALATLSRTCRGFPQTPTDHWVKARGAEFLSPPSRLNLHTEVSQDIDRAIPQCSTANCVQDQMNSNEYLIFVR